MPACPQYLVSIRASALLQLLQRLGLGLVVIYAATLSTVLAQDLQDLIDPAADAQWSTEQVQSQVDQRLKRWQKRLATGEALDAELTDNCLCAALLPAQLSQAEIAGGISVRSGPLRMLDHLRWNRLDAEFTKLVQPLQAIGLVRSKFKITTVRKSQQFVHTGIRLEASADSDEHGAQIVARFNLCWKVSGTADHLFLRLAFAHGIDFERADRLRSLFTEVTARVIPTADQATLSQGGESWFGRIDAVGESSLMGHNGMALGDVNGDGAEDLYIAMGTGLPNRLFIRQRDGSLKETAAAANVAWLDDTKGCVFADMDNDGDQDLLCAIGPLIVLAKNNGKGTFTRIVSMRAKTPAAFYSVAVADIDQDGDLDIYGCRYVRVAYGVSIPVPFHDARNGPSNHLMRNDGNDRYVDITQSSGLMANNNRFSLSAAFGDYDDDGDQDLYVANDFGRNNLYRNDNGRFTDVAASAGVEDQAAGMGAAWADIDGDGDLDLLVTNMWSAAGRRIAYQSAFLETSDNKAKQRVQAFSTGNSLFENLGNGRFRDISERAGIRMGRWGWGAGFADLNNDGRDDIVATNGFLTGRKKDDL